MARGYSGPTRKGALGEIESPVLPVLLLLAACDPAPPAPAEFEARRVALRDATRALVDDLEAAGRYDCCIETPCAMCASRAAGCRCGEGLRAGEPVCEECALMWAQGLGAEPGVEAGTVRSYLEASRRGPPLCGERR